MGNQWGENEATGRGANPQRLQYTKGKHAAPGPKVEGRGGVKRVCVIFFCNRKWQSLLSHKTRLTGVILSDNGNTVSIEFDNSVRKSVKKELVELNENVIEWTSLKDRYVRVPIGLWNDGTCPYRKSNRSIKNGILFKITKKHYKNVATVF